MFYPCTVSCYMTRDILLLYRKIRYDWGCLTFVSYHVVGQARHITKNGEKSCREPPVGKTVVFSKTKKNSWKTEYNNNLIFIRIFEIQKIVLPILKLKKFLSKEKRLVNKNLFLAKINFAKQLLPFSPFFIQNERSTIFWEKKIFKIVQTMLEQDTDIIYNSNNDDREQKGNRS